MRYPLANVRPFGMHGAMLDAYNAENAKLKESLNKAAEASRVDWGRKNPGAAFSPPKLPNNVTQTKYDPCPSGYVRSQSPPFDCLPEPPQPGGFKPGMRPLHPGFTDRGPFVPTSVASGGMDSQVQGPELEPNPVPSVDQRKKCPLGFTRNLAPPYECRPDTISPSNDRYKDPSTIDAYEKAHPNPIPQWIQPQPQQTEPSGMTPTQGASSPKPPPAPPQNPYAPVATPGGGSGQPGYSVTNSGANCDPARGLFPDGKGGCRGSVATGGAGGFGGLIGPGAGSGLDLFNMNPGAITGNLLSGRRPIRAVSMGRRMP